MEIPLGIYLERPLSICKDPLLHLIARCIKAIGGTGNIAILGNFYLERPLISWKWDLSLGHHWRSILYVQNYTFLYISIRLRTVVITQVAMVCSLSTLTKEDMYDFFKKKKVIEYVKIESWESKIKSSHCYSCFFFLLFIGLAEAVG